MLQRQLSLPEKKGAIHQASMQEPGFHESIPQIRPGAFHMLRIGINSRCAALSNPQFATSTKPMNQSSLKTEWTPKKWASQKRWTLLRGYPCVMVQIGTVCLRHTKGSHPCRCLSFRTPHQYVERFSISLFLEAARLSRHWG